MANNIQLAKKEDYNKVIAEFTKKHSPKGAEKRTLINSFGNGEYLEETVFEDGTKIFLEKRHVREMASTSLNGLDFTLEIPMIKCDFWTSDQPQTHKYYYEKEKTYNVQSNSR